MNRLRQKMRFCLLFASKKFANQKGQEIIQLLIVLVIVVISLIPDLIQTTGILKQGMTTANQALVQYIGA